MNISYTTEFTINKDIRKLIPETSRDSITTLKSSIRKNGGCKDPIIIWKDVIIDGYERYKICKSLKIDFNVKYIKFSNIEDVEYFILKILLENNFKNRSLDVYNLYKRYKFIAKYMDKICTDINNHETWCTPLLNNKKIKLNKDNKLTLASIAYLCNTSTTCLKKVIEIYECDYEDLKNDLENGKLSPNSAYAILRSKKMNKKIKESEIIENTENANNNIKTNTAKSSVSFDFIKDELRNIFDLTVINIKRVLELMKDNDLEDLYNQAQLLTVVYDNKVIIENLIKDKFNKR